MITFVIQLFHNQTPWTQDKQNWGIWMQKEHDIIDRVTRIEESKDLWNHSLTVVKWREVTKIFTMVNDDLKEMILIMANMDHLSFAVLVW